MLCRQCFKHYDEFEEQKQPQEHTEADFIYEHLETSKKKLNLSLESIDVSPVVLKGVAEHSRVPSAKRKLGQAMVKLRDDLSTVYKVDASELNLPSVEPDKETKEKALELDRLHDLMRKKLEISKTPEQIQIMTLAPDSWSRGQCAQFFNVF